MIHHLVQNESRNNLIATKVAEVLEQNRFPLLVSDRKDHLELLEQLVKKMSPDVEIVVLEGLSRINNTVGLSLELRSFDWVRRK